MECEALGNHRSTVRSDSYDGRAWLFRVSLSCLIGPAFARMRALTIGGRLPNRCCVEFVADAANAFQKCGRGRVWVDLSASWETNVYSVGPEQTLHLVICKRLDARWIAHLLDLARKSYM